MRKVILFGVLVFTALNVQAQIRLKLKSDRRYFLPYEKINLTIEVENNSGNTLSFAKDAQNRNDGYISCLITDEHGRLCRESGTAQSAFQKAGVNLGQSLVLPAGARRTLTVAVNRYYDVHRPLNYEIKAKVMHPKFSKDFLSGALTVSVIPGVEVMERKFGMPTADGVQIPQRSAKLLSFHSPEGAQYVLRIEDAKKIYCTHRLVQHMSGDHPQIQVDARSQVHVIIQTDPKMFAYWYFSPDGNLKQLSNYEYTKTAGVPGLIRDPDIGRVMVRGGVKIIPGEDEELELPIYQGEVEMPEEE